MNSLRIFATIDVMGMSIPLRSISFPTTGREIGPWGLSYSVGSSLLVQDCWAMRRPLNVERAMVKDSRFLLYKLNQRSPEKIKILMAPDNLHIGQLIQKVFRSLHKDKDVKWFADCLHCDRSNIYDIFKRNNIDIRLLSKIGKILEYDFFVHLSNQSNASSIIIKDANKEFDKSKYHEFIYQILLNTPDSINTIKILAKIWHNGKTGFPKNVHNSFKFYQIGAQCGDSECQFALGEMYEHGIGTKKDPYKALEWYAKAAQQGNAKAAKRLMW